MSGEGILYRDFAAAHAASYVRIDDIVWAEIVGGRDTFSGGDTGPITVGVPTGIMFNEALAAHVVGHLDLIFACRPRGQGDADQIVRDLMEICAEPGHPDWANLSRRYEIVAEAIREAVLPGSGSIYSRGFLYAKPGESTPVESGTPSPFRQPFPVDVVRAYIATMDRTPVAPAPTPVPPAPAPPPAQPAAPTGMQVLWQLSHHSSIRPDGWSGAPDEARWIREDLTPRVIAECAKIGIDVVTVDGDLLDHSAYHADYDAFAAPHYEANLHGEGGAFWGRAATSVTAAEDDRLGTIFWRRYRALPGCPPDRFGWKGVNVTDYYAFRLTSARTPGFLVEHGVGWRLPEDYDFTWLRQNTQTIAEVWALAFAEFGNIEITHGGPKPSPSLMEEDMFTEDDRRKLDRVYAHAEAYEALDWIGRLQKWLARAILSIFPSADLSGPDVRTGETFKSAPTSPPPGPVPPPAPPPAQAFDLSGPKPPFFPAPYNAGSTWHRIGNLQPIATSPEEVVYTVDIPGDTNGNRDTFVFSPMSPVARKY